MIVSTRARNLLIRISKSEDEELVQEDGAGSWIDCDKVAGRDVMELIRFCLISTEEAMDCKYRRWHVNEEGRALIADPEYRPMITRKKGSHDHH